MRTDSLIRTLAADTRIAPKPQVRLASSLIPAVLLAAAAVWATMGFRPDLAQSLVTTNPILRILLALALGLAGTRIALVLARPEGRALARLWPLAAVAIVALGLLLLTFAGTPSGTLGTAIRGKTMSTCLIVIPLLSILPVAAILTTLRGGATTAPALAGCVAGLAGGGLAAAVYALHCTEDNPLFYVTWYGTAILGVTFASTLIGIRVLRW
jgi:hypothetical protein